MSEYEKGRNFRDWIEASVELSVSAPSPPIFRRWAAISAIAGALGRKCWYNVGPYVINPNLFIVLVGAPASGKGVAMALPIQLVFRKLAVHISAAGPHSENWSEVWKKYGLEKPFRVAADRVTPESLIEDMSKNLNKVDWTLTPFDSLEPFFDSSVTVIVPEFGTFLRRTYETLPTFLTAMWDHAPAYNHGTIKRGSNIIKGPCLNWLSGAVPEEFAASLPENAQEQGLLSRIIPVFYDGPPFPKKFKDTSYADASLEWLRQDLARIGNIKGEFDWESKELYEEVEHWNLTQADPVPNDPKLKFYKERRVGHIIKVAMVVSAARRNDRKITRADWDTTRDLMIEMEANMPKALQSFGLSQMGQISRDLEQFLMAHPGGMTLQKFRRYVLNSARSVAEMLMTEQALLAAGIIHIDRSMVYPRSVLKGTNTLMIEDKNVAP